MISLSVQLECIHFTFLFMNKIQANTEIKDQNLSPSNVVTFLYVCTYVVHVSRYVYRICSLNLKQCAMCKAWGINLQVCSEIAEPSCHQPKQRAEMI